MLLRFRTMSAALIAGVMILGIGVAEARADVIYSTGGQGEIIDTVVGFSDSPLVDESTMVPLSATDGPDLTSVKITASDFTGKSAQLEIHSDLLDYPGTISEAIIPIIRPSNTAYNKSGDRSRDRSRSTRVGLNLLADSNHLMSTTLTDRDDILIDVKRHDVGSAFSDDANSTVIVAIVDAAYRIQSILVSGSSPLTDPGTLALLGLSLAGLGYIGRRRVA